MSFHEETTEKKAKRILEKIIKTGGVSHSSEMSFIVLHANLFKFPAFKRKKRRCKLCGALK